MVLHLLVVLVVIRLEETVRHLRDRYRVARIRQQTIYVARRDAQLLLLNAAVLLLRFDFLNCLDVVLETAEDNHLLHVVTVGDDCQCSVADVLDARRVVRVFYVDPHFLIEEEHVNVI